ncbi:DUF3515 domain-containing protein [Streptomyces sp. DvalAA-14]|uniref:DUF3515 domain-containing protein n=1 Tax=Streptomyces sp. DvalAA-14 TaxID=1839759 RepID=UPI000B84B0CD|nr:DUF3515 domain-containing protein [Streptomyces sp. DvalAA-14]MYS22259.1 DUF3515 family protein [Streptomyces sp. SID4948]
MSAVACLSAAAVYALASGPGEQRIAVPVPDARVAGYCAALHAQLPAKLNGLSRHDLKPDSDLIAGWGHPSVVLRCGVPRPAADADPDTDAAEVDGVTWSFQQDSDGSVRMTTTLRKAYVELLLPPKYAHDASPLQDLAAPVKRTIPEGV